MSGRIEHDRPGVRSLSIGHRGAAVKRMPDHSGDILHMKIQMRHDLLGARFAGQVGR